MRIKVYKTGFYLFILLFSILAITCDNGPTTPTCNAGASTRTNGCDEFMRVQSVVRKAPAGGTFSTFTGTGWHPLATGDQLSTDSNGEAELNFSSCYPGRIYIFKTSGGAFEVEQCSEAEFTSASGSCVPFGDWYVGACAGEFTINTPSAKITKTGTSLSITFLQNNREITLVVVMEGSVSVEPIDSNNPTVFATADDVRAGEFYFTMPLPLTRVAGLDPRVSYPLPDLFPVAVDLGIEDRLIAIRRQAEVDGVLPGNWPPELGGPVGGEPPGPDTPDGGVLVTSGSGPLGNSLVQEGMYTAVNWPLAMEVAGIGDQPVVVLIGDDRVNVNDLAYDPERARQLFEEAGYFQEQPVNILILFGDEQLVGIGQVMIENLAEVGIEALIQEVPPEEVDNFLAELTGAGEPYILIGR
jgi:hypothetical protein